jgi:hypothetical protein
MSRHHTKAIRDDAGNQIGQENVPFTVAEEAAQDALDVTSAANRPMEDMARFRTERNALLDSSDWTQGNDSPLDDEAKTSWAEYRQLLRDLPATETDPANPTWPSAPE